MPFKTTSRKRANRCGIKWPLAVSSLLAALGSQQVSAQQCSGAADIWFANDESGSVDDTEMTYALDFLYKVADEFVFDPGEGAQAAVFGWSDANGPFDYVLPASASFGDPDDSGYLDPNGDGSRADSNIVVDGDGNGIRESYVLRTYSNGTWLAKATNELASRIGNNADSNSDGTTDNGRRTGVPQIAVLLTDAFDTQLKNTGSGASAGQEGGADWDAAISNLVTTAGGTKMVLMLIDAAATAYNTDADTKTLIDGFVNDYDVSLFVGATYSEIADPVNGHISGLTQTVCLLTDITTKITGQSTFLDNSTFTVAIDFSDDVNGFDISDISAGNGSLSNLVQLSASSYTVDVTPDGSNSDITLDIADATAQHSDGRNNRAAVQKVVQFDGDGDGIGDTDEGTTTDSDGDGIFDHQDLDSDNDGIPDVEENDAGGAVDTDGDGVADYLDLDSDNDGVLDIWESGSDTAIALDTDGDGQIDLGNSFGSDGLANDLQSGGDGGALNYTVADTDGDGVRDFRDLDSDNDSLSDLVESGIDQTTVASLDADSDGDIDNPAENAANAVGTDGIADSLQSNVDGAPVTHTLADTDEDTVPDFRDLDTDNDGIADITESGNSAAAALDSDGSGRIESNEASFGADGIADGAQGGADGGALPPASNSDAGNETGAVIPDFRDIDSDNDGLNDSEEAGVTDANSDGIADGTDGDGDGMIDSGYTVNPVDTSPSDSPDYQNPDSNGAGGGDDNDSDPEANALDTSPNDGVLDDTTDSDGDGLADSLDDKNGHADYADPFLVVAETGGDTLVNEAGAGNTDTFTIALSRPPVSDVVVDLAVVDSSEANLSSSSVTFNSSNWDTPQTITVTGIDDGAVDGNQVTSISTVVADASSSDEFDGQSASIGLDVLDTTPDADNDGIADAQEGAGDTDGDGTPDAQDTDSDNDGIPDSVEAGSDPFNPTDSDGDGIPDFRELDSDNDGIVDLLEVGGDANNPVDSDNDGRADYADIDSDGDGIPDNLEDRRSPELADQDVVGSGSGGNGIDDAIDVLVTGGSDNNGNGVDDALEPSDDDGDNTPSHLDLDSDGDGILDIYEASNVPALANNDVDNDGIDDALDVDQTLGSDSNGDGIDDAFAPRDSDGDGVADYLDRDSDNDGIEDSEEASVNVLYSGTDSDNDGIDDAVDVSQTGGADNNSNGIDDAYEPADTDGDGVADYLDLDSDADGIYDLIESGSSISPTLDSDSDGRIDGSESVGDDGLVDALQSGGDGGALNYTLADTDGDGFTDYRDLDSDNDSLSDLVESGLSQAAVASLDADNDGAIDNPTGNPANSVGSDGVVDSLQSGSDGNGYDHSLADTDADNIADFRDQDSDGDGLPDLIEAGNSAAIALDSNDNGVLEASEVSVGSDGIANAAQGGSDGGSLPAPRNSDAANESGPAIPDFRDLDSDNDGLTDVDEAGALDFNRDALVDGDDANGDGLVDSGYVTSPIDTAPSDTPDYRNPDGNGAGAGDDNDNNADVAAFDVAPNDGVLDDTTDSDGDGIADVLDDFTGPGVEALPEVVVRETLGQTQVTESGAGDNDTFSVILRAEPTSDVVVLISSADSGEGTVAPNRLTFTPANWNVAQLVTVTGVEDGWVDGNQLVGLTLAVDNAASAAEYQDLGASLTLSVLDSSPDSDGDGISDALEGTGDSDGDGILDVDDSDSDNDGIPDSVEVGSDRSQPADSDGDGLADYLDLDADNDGVVDYLETGPSPMVPDDTDGDGRVNYLDLDSDADGIPDALEDRNSPVLSGLDAVGTVDGVGNGIDDAIDALATNGNDANNDGIDDDLAPSDDDGDQLYNHRDLDSDGDGILDRIEANNMPALTGSDQDGDGIDDALDVDLTGGVDNNGDGADDALAPRDSDGDGIPDFVDIDSDNDGIGDAQEAFILVPEYANIDSDGDGIDDALDADNGGPVTDLNGNGISDIYEPMDSDGDGIPDYRDLDSDNDSLPDIFESGGEDSNGDGLIDSLDAQATTTEAQDTDGDGIADHRDLESVNAANDGTGPFDISSSLAGADVHDTAPRDGALDDITDTDGDGIADSVDEAPDTFGLGIRPAMVTDSDGDGLANALDLDADNDGIPNSVEGFDPANPENSTDTDGDGIADYLDLDSDNDGMFDLLEANELAADIDANGRVDAMVDEWPMPIGDGLDDTIDDTFSPVDTDGDGVADYLDLDSDNDGLSDLLESVSSIEEYESLDSDGDGMADDIDLKTGLPLNKDNGWLALRYVDSDLDGKANFRDLDSDADGFDDAVEGADGDGDGVMDSVENSSGQLQTSVSGSGSMGGFAFAIMLLALIYHRLRSMPAAIAVLLLAPLLLISVPSVRADNVCGNTYDANGYQRFKGCWYLGIGFGVSHVDPEGNSNGWRTEDDQSNGFEVMLGTHFNPNWFAELKYANLGKAGLGHNNRLVEELYPDAALYYKVPSLMVGYYLFDTPRRFNPYVKIGVAGINTGVDNDGGTADFEEVNSSQLAFGAGVQLFIRDEPMMLRLNFDSYDQDAWYLSFSAQYRFQVSD